jgi:serine-protein kinase ATM
VKGLDDIRKDAVMQQVFRYVNSMMKRTRAKGSRKSAITTRKLQLVTYNIIPLSPNTGVLEWVEETMPFGDFLVDKPGKVAAHSRYNPGELGYLACRRKIMDADATNRRQVYDEVCQNFSPAFRFFFIEEFITNLQDWHAAKVRYTRSCAVSSIVGHMLGIGDRHSQNILIHKKTGEVVHIDFGIVFEQGRELQVPETVPFRLTRDIVDGMGPTETSGTFSRAAEETTRVLRENSKALLTILSAIVADPLYKWKKAAEKARKRQQLELLLGEEGENCSPPSRKSKAQTFIEEADDEEENAGTRAINKIHEKLQGLEEGTSSERQSVESQVQLLINAARDPDNLCALYHGWSAWL